MTDSVGFIAGLVPSATSGKLKITGLAHMSPNGVIIYWEVEVNFTDLATTINTAIKNAIVAAAATAGFTIDALDKNTLLAAASGL